MDHNSSDRNAFDTTLGNAGPERSTSAENDEAAARNVLPEAVPSRLDRVPADATSPQLAAAAQPAVALQPNATPPSSDFSGAQLPRKTGKKKLLLAALLLAGCAGGGHYGWNWWTVGRFQETTDNAFLQADKVTVSPRISGFVTAVAVGDNQAVQAGDVIATIDDRDARIGVAGARAELDKARAQLDGYKAAVIQQAATVASAKADITNAEAGLAFATQDAKRYADLLTSGAGTSQRAQQTDADLRQHAGDPRQGSRRTRRRAKAGQDLRGLGGQRGRRHRGPRRPSSIRRS